MTTERANEHRPARLLSLHARVRRAIGRTATRCFDSLRSVGPGRAWHRALIARLEFSETEVAVSGGAASAPESHRRNGLHGLDGLSILFLSDVHAGLFQTRENLDALADAVVRRAPDLLLFGGDLVATRFAELDLFERLFGLPDPPLGKFAVPGNHDLFYSEGGDEGPADYRRRLEEHGVRVLVNEGVRLERGGSTLWLAGVDDAEEGTPDLDVALEGRHDGEVSIVLSHHPDVFRPASERGVHLQLSGHTHGGQILLGSWAPVTHSRYGYVSGLYRREEAQLYVSRGVGVSFAPVRIGAPPEAPTITLRIR